MSQSAEKDAPVPEWILRAVTLHDHFDGRITLRVAMPQPQYNTVQLNSEYKGDFLSVDVDIDALRAALDAVDTRVFPPAKGDTR